MKNDLIPAWDKRLLKNGGHFLQSRVWLSFQESLGQELMNDIKPRFQWGGYVVRGKGGVRYLYVPYGPLLKTEDDMQQALESMASSANKLGCMFVRFDQISNISPEIMIKLGLVYFGDVQPDTTHVLDLNEDLAIIKGRMSKTDRNLINRSEKNGTEYIISVDTQDIATFLDLMLSTAQYKAYRAKSRDYLEKQLIQLVNAGIAKLYFAEYEGKKAAGAIGVDWGNIRYYLHAGGDQSVVRKLPVARGLVWFMVKNAKEQGLQVFDFYGVSPSKDDRGHRLASVSNFKRSFGGQDKSYGGAWDLPLQKNRYRLYRYLRSLSSSL